MAALIDHVEEALEDVGELVAEPHEPVERLPCVDGGLYEASGV